MNRQDRLPQTAVAPLPKPVASKARQEKAQVAGAEVPRDRRTLGLVLDRLVAFFSSLRLTVFCLGLGLVLVFWGTLAQVDLGLYKAQNEFFRSFFIYWGPKGATWRLPIFPG